MRSDDMIEEQAADDAGFAIAYGLLRVAAAVRDLGNGNATTSMGALEALGVRLGDAVDRLTAAVDRLGIG